MKVADFFCGGGGFSEGFREAGFEITYAVDKWKPAVETHHANHPNAITEQGDVEKISYLEFKEFEKTIPDTEIIIGSPPCVAFSNSNKSGKADKSLGIRLVESYLRIIYRKLYKNNSILVYWVLENVPNLKKYIKKEYTATELGIKSEYGVPTDKVLKVIYQEDNIYNAKYYGVPSNRKRFICGNFPKPCVTTEEKDIITLEKVLNSLGNPMKSKKEKNILVEDMFNKFTKERVEITDHHYIHLIPEFQWKKAKRAKRDKGYMGKMSFPENLEKPARTVMATMSFSSRESMIFGYKKDNYRAPTIREVATLMSFPIDYKFYGKSLEAKHRLVGNAVPPKMAFSIAKAIADKEGCKIPEYQLINHNESNIEFINYNFKKIPLKQEKKKSLKAKYKYHIPYFIKKTYRVELSNYNSDFDKLDFKWDVKIHKSQGKNASIYELDLCLINDYFKEKLLEKLNCYVNIYCENNLNNLNFNLLQNNYINIQDESKLITPDMILYNLKDFLEELHVCSSDCKNQGELAKFPLKILVGYYILKKIINYVGGK